MRIEVRDLWVAALRSGRFRQGRGTLTRLFLTDMPSIASSTHCCLGVLCELALEAGVPLTVEDRDGRRSYDGELNYLPRAVVTWAGLDSHNPTVQVDVNTRRSLASLNDDQHSSFEVVAVAIVRGLR